jgi:integrase
MLSIRPQANAKKSYIGLGSSSYGWHTLRRTLATLLVSQGTPIKLAQEMLRHANSRITLELYAQSNMPAKLEAQRAC